MKNAAGKRAGLSRPALVTIRLGCAATGLGRAPPARALASQGDSGGGAYGGGSISGSGGGGGGGGWSGGGDSSDDDGDGSRFGGNIGTLFVFAAAALGLFGLSHKFKQEPEAQGAGGSPSKRLDRCAALPAPTAADAPRRSRHSPPPCRPRRAATTCAR